jgi:hypothetical protein
LDIPKVVKDLNKLLLAILHLKPVLGLLGSLLFYLVPDADLKAKSENALHLAILLEVVGVLLLPSLVLDVPDADFGSISCPVCTSQLSTCRLRRFG